MLANQIVEPLRDPRKEEPYLGGEGLEQAALRLGKSDILLHLFEKYFQMLRAFWLPSLLCVKIIC